MAATGLSSAQFGALALGRSNAQWGSLMLPLDLAPLGAPGCRVFASQEFVQPLVIRSGAATVRVPVPGNPWLLGRSLYVQALAAKPQANALGVVTSNGGRLRIGRR